MADRTALKLVGLVFGLTAIAVMVAAAIMIKAHADGRYRLEGAGSIIIGAER
jgi:nitrous oxidase accessory protein NosD